MVGLNGAYCRTPPIRDPAAGPLVDHPPLHRDGATHTKLLCVTIR